MSVNVLYRTKATANGGRDGKAQTADGTFSVTLATPKELGGAGGAGNNPEQLFAAGYSACFLGAMKFVGGQEKIKVPAETTVTAEVGMITPPVGLNVFVVKSSSPVPVTLGQAFTGVTPFILLDFLSLGIYVAFPEMILWLPNLMTP